MHNGITWNVVQRIMSDLPSYDYNAKDDKKKDDIKLTAENADSIMNFINNMQ